MEVTTALRVVRGPDWTWGDQDGGEWHVGTVVESDQYKVGGSVVVQWDCGNRCRYRCGERGKYDLRVLDSAPTGMKFADIRCSGCCTEGIKGLAWKCLQCFDYHLCTVCYMAGKHIFEHRFDCIITADRKNIRVPPRCDTQRVELRGLFPGALVTRGRDWRWGNQDGGVGKFGKILSIRGWSNETARSVVEVEWKDKGKKNIYRVGHNGKVDLTCTVAGSGGFFFPEHMPVLGAPCVPPDPKDFASGDRVRAELDMDVFHSLGEGTSEVMEQVLMFLDHVGTVNSILDSGDLLVRYPSNALMPVSPEAATKVDLPDFHIGDVVRILDDMTEVFKLQKDHGEWNDDMALSLGQVGVVTKEFPSGDVQVDVNGKRWTYNALCLEPSPEESPPASTGIAVTDLDMRMQLFSLTAEMSPELVVAAAAAGDITTLRNYLMKQPSEVNAKYKGKTAVHAAIEDGRTDALKVLLEFKANLELGDGEGEKPLHGCAFLNQFEAARVLLDAGADINCRNGKSNTPLMICAAVGHYKLLKLLTEHKKVDIHAQDIIGNTALHHAVASQRTKSVILLLDAGADPAFFNLRCFAPIHDAAGYGFLPALEEFVTRFPQHVNLKRPNDCHTPLHIASANNRLYAVTLLARVNSCDINAENDLKRTPLHVAAIDGHCRVIERLVGFGADLNHVDNDGNTPLHIVFIKKNAKPLNDAPQMNKVRSTLLSLHNDGNFPGHMILACFLVQEGADVHIKNKGGHSPMYLCPPDMQTLILNFVNKSSNCSFHGSLRSIPELQPAVHPSASLLSEDPKSSDGIQIVKPALLPGYGNQPTISETIPCFMCDSPADVSFDPCGHRVMCSQCAGSAKRCPVCKVAVQTVHRGMPANS